MYCFLQIHLCSLMAMEDNKDIPTKLGCDAEQYSRVL